jgi:hypothetical protein
VKIASERSIWPSSFEPAAFLQASCTVPRKRWPRVVIPSLMSVAPSAFASARRKSVPVEGAGTTYSPVMRTPSRFEAVRST